MTGDRDVTHVLLADGVWHVVVGRSFGFCDAFQLGAGFTFLTGSDQRITGPLSSLLAIKTGARVLSDGAGPSFGDEAPLDSRRRVEIG